MSPDPDSDVILRLLKEQLKQSQQGSLENSKVLSALNRNPADIGPWKTNVTPTPEIGSWKTNIIPGNPGQFSRPLPQTMGGGFGSPNEQQYGNAIQYLDKNIDYTPGPRLSNNFEDRTQGGQDYNRLLQHDALPMPDLMMLIKSIFGKR